MATFEEIKARDAEYVAGTYGRFNMCIAKGKGARCVSVEGKEYIDFTSGIGVNCLGFADDGWVKAVSDQIAKYQHVSNLYYSEPCGELAELLVKRTPGMKKVFFGNSGAEANECAIKVARKYGNTKYGNDRNEIITMINSFHGRTVATITATGQDHYHEFFDPFLPGFRYAEANNIESVKSLVSDRTCAIMLEIVQGEGGVIPLDAGFLAGVQKICDDNDILFVIDEVQTGIGRTGKFFAYEHFGLRPDIVTFAKGVGGGLPIGGAIMNDKCCDVLKPGDHGTTYGGNPVACAAGVEVMKRVTPEFIEEVAKKGAYLKEKLLKMPHVKDVTGLGMMIGIGLEGREAKEVLNACLENGLMVLTAKDKVRFLPPLVVTYDDIDDGLAIFEKALSE